VDLAGARADALPVPGPATGCLAAAARRESIYVVAGVTERAGELVYNAAVLISPAGEILIRHRKINELDTRAISMRLAKVSSWPERMWAWWALRSARTIFPNRSV
jgi:predicted amidohydrolase